MSLNSAISTESDSLRYPPSVRYMKGMISRYRYEILMKRLHPDRKISAWAKQNAIH